MMRAYRCESRRSRRRLRLSPHWTDLELSQKRQEVMLPKLERGAVGGGQARSRPDDEVVSVAVQREASCFQVEREQYG